MTFHKLWVPVLFLTFAIIAIPIGGRTASWSSVQANAPTLENAGDAGSNTVSEGQARFQVLTPTLFRMEYAADGGFENQTTFNVVNRHFPSPHFTTKVIDGWREIHTDKLVLRYKVGSGPFTHGNLEVDLMTGATPITAHPEWQVSTACEGGKRCEAEDATLEPTSACAADNRCLDKLGHHSHCFAPKCRD